MLVLLITTRIMSEQVVSSSVLTPDGYITNPHQVRPTIMFKSSGMDQQWPRTVGRDLDH